MVLYVAFSQVANESVVLLVAVEDLKKVLYFRYVFMYQNSRMVVCIHGVCQVYFLPSGRVRTFPILIHPGCSEWRSVRKVAAEFIVHILKKFVVCGDESLGSEGISSDDASFCFEAKPSTIRTLYGVQYRVVPQSYSVSCSWAVGSLIQILKEFIVARPRVCLSNITHKGSELFAL